VPISSASVSSAASFIWVIDGGEIIVVTPRQKGFLQKTTRFDTACLVVIPFGCRPGAMTKQMRRDANVCWVMARVGIRSNLMV